MRDMIAEINEKLDEIERKEGVRSCTRYKEIEVDYLDQEFKKQHGKYSGFTAQIIQHEIQHFSGELI